MGFNLTHTKDMMNILNDFEWHCTCRVKIRGMPWPKTFYEIEKGQGHIKVTN